VSAAREPSVGARPAPRVWCGRLARLALRRVAPRTRVLTCALLGAWIASRDWAPRAWSAVALEPALDPALARGLAREAAWRAGTVLLLPLAAWQGARIFARWRGGEGNYLAASPAAPSALVVSSLAGMLFGIGLLVVAGGAAVELALGLPRGPALRLAWSRSASDPPRVEPGGRLEVRLAAPPLVGEGRVRARLRPTFGASPTTVVDLSVRPAEGDGTRAGAVLEGAPLVAPTWLEVPAPPAAGALIWSLHDVGEGPLALEGEGTFEVWEPVRYELAAAGAMVPALWLALAAVAALAFGFAAWVTPPTAAAGSGAALLATLSLPAVSPAAGLGVAFEHLALGRVPALPPPAAWLACGAALGLSLLLARGGARGWGGGR